MDLGMLLQTSPHAVVVVRPEGTLVWANDAAVGLLGGAATVPGEGGSLLPLLAPRHRGRAQQLLAAVVGGASGGPVYLRLAEEPERWVAVRGAPAEDGTAQLAVVDVTDSVLSRQRVRASEARFREAFGAGVVGQAVLDPEGRITVANAALGRLLDRPAGQLVGEVLSRCMVDGQEPVPPGAVRVPRRFHRPDGEVRATLVTTHRLSGEGDQVLAQVEDVTERQVSEQRLRHLALHDALTDLPGRPLVLSRLDLALDRGDAGLVAVLFVDLDGFKLVNDALGHAAGDQVLVEAAHRLRGAVRPGDTVGRFGGDEFLVVCPGLADRDQGLAVARRVERAIGAPFPFRDDEVLVSASVGVAFADPSADDRPLADDLVHDADTAMYRAKQLGKRRFEVFDHAMRERAAERARLEKLLGRAVAEDRVVVHYQPVVELRGRTVVGLEALLRIRDDDGTLLLPGTFLDIAQEAGLLPSLDDVVLVRATATVAGLRSATGLDLNVAVNVCAASVDAELPGKVDAALAASALPAGSLVVELTEQALVSSGQGAASALQRLSDRGVAIAIDDFGTGWASLTYLRRFPVRIVKVDRSFVAGLPDEQDDLVIVRAVVDLSKQLGLDCVAEGVEDEEQYAVLRALDPPFAQGFLFSPPLPPEDVLALLQR